MKTKLNRTIEKYSGAQGKATFVNDYRDLEIDYELCSDNITKLEDQLAPLYPNVPGTDISIYDGINREDCFHPGRFYGCYSV